MRPSSSGALFTFTYPRWDDVLPLIIMIVAKNASNVLLLWTQLSWCDYNTVMTNERHVNQTSIHTSIHFTMGHTAYSWKEQLSCWWGYPAWVNKTIIPIFLFSIFRRFVGIFTLAWAAPFEIYCLPGGGATKYYDKLKIPYSALS